MAAKTEWFQFWQLIFFAWITSLNKVQVVLPWRWSDANKRCLSTLERWSGCSQMPNMQLWR